MSLRPFLATDWPIPPGSGLLALFLLLGFLGGGDFLCAVQERAQCHPAEHVPMSLLDELHQLANVAVQTLGRKKGGGGMCSGTSDGSREGKHKENGSIRTWTVCFHMYKWMGYAAGMLSLLAQQLQLVSGWVASDPVP